MQLLGEVCAQLRRWPRRIAPDLRSLARECLDASCDLFRAERAVLVIDDGDEPWVSIATRDGESFSLREDEDLSLESVVVDELANRAFLIDDHGQVLAAGEDPIPVDTAIDSRIREQLSDGPLVSVPVLADSLQGRLFVCRPDVPNDIATIVADPLAAILAIKFESTAQVRAAVREAVERERIRVARDLHDGLLQSFTGIVLQLETVHSALITDPVDAQRMITDTQGIIMADQRELRRFVEQLRPRPAHRETTFDFAARLEDLRSRFEKQWGIRIAYDVRDVDPLVSGFIGQETYRLIHEAVTNSAKHGRASHVDVSVSSEGSEMHIEVSDNGTGFPFHGRLTLEDMRESGNGPTVLAERVSSLNGRLVVNSTETGAIVTMTVPLGFGA